MRFTLLGFAPLVAFACTSDPTANTTLSMTEPTTTSGSSSEAGPTTDEPSTSEPADSSSTSVTEDPTTGSSTNDPTTSEEDTNMGALCGDNIISGPEDCDCGLGMECGPEDLGGLGCADVKDPLIPGTITGGILGCNQASCRFDTSMCTYCGDDEVNGNEECEPDEDIEQSCASLGAGIAGPLTCDSDCRIDTSGCTDCAFVVDFETDTCPAGFSTQSLDPGAAASSWSCGEPSAYAQGPGQASPGTFGTNLIGAYSANEISALVSPQIDVSRCQDSGLLMQLRHWHNFEGGVSNADGGIVQASDDGITWTTITPTDGDLYGDMPITATYAPVNGVLGFTAEDNDNQWSDSTFDLSDYAGSNTLQLRFVFGSNGSVQSGGWYIDRLELVGSGS